MAIRKVNSRAILDGAIVTTDVAAGAVGTTQLAAGAVTSDKIASTAQPYSFKNRIINGAMVIDQRNSGASVTPANSYTLDRWSAANSQSSKFTVQQNAGSVTPPTGFTNYLGVTSTSAYTLVAGDYFAITQIIEGFNVADFAWGTANASAVTLSFYVYSSLTGTFGGAIRNNVGVRYYPFNYSIPVANTWTKIAITIPGDTVAAPGAGNLAGFAIWLSLGAGSTYSGTAGSWSAGGYTSATGATSVVGTNGATFYITGVQLEKGSVATSFDYRPIGMELNLCFRYYYKYVGSGTFYLQSAYRGAAGDYYVNYPLPQLMRTTPTITATIGTDINGFNGVTPYSTGYTQPNFAYMAINSTGSGAGYYSLGSITASAEL